VDGAEAKARHGRSRSLSLTGLLIRDLLENHYRAEMLYYRTTRCKI
jgi:hypothetical protein